MSLFPLRTWILLGLAIGPFSLAGQDVPKEVSALPAALAAASDLTDHYRVTPNIVYRTIGTYPDKLDVYRRKGAGAKPTLVYIHGGGWRGGPSKEEYSLWFEPFLVLGWNVVNVEYRPSTVAPAPAAVEDCECALRWVLRNAKQYDFDLNQIVVMGHSAGAHLALMAAMPTEAAGFGRECEGSETPKVAAIVDWFGITDVADLIAGPNTRTWARQWIGHPADEKAIAKKVSPLTYVREGLPPTILIHGDQDPKVPYPQAVQLHDALRAAHVPTELITIPGGGHGGFGTEQTRKAYARVFDFLASNGIKIQTDSSK